MLVRESVKESEVGVSMNGKDAFDILPSSLRKWSYAVIAIVVLLLGGAVYAFTSVGVTVPVVVAWGLAFFTFISAGGNLVAAQNTPTKRVEVPAVGFVGESEAVDALSGEFVEVDGLTDYVPKHSAEGDVSV